MAIFGKSDATHGPPPAPHRHGDTAFGDPAPAAGGSTVIGTKTRFVGDVSGEQDIIVHGRLEGNVRVSSRVTVAPSGELKGDVHARSVVVGGRVQGQILAEERAELLASASVQGNVNAPKVVIAEGAQLQGSVAMAMAAAADPLGAAPVHNNVEEK